MMVNVDASMTANRAAFTLHREVRRRPRSTSAPKLDKPDLVELAQRTYRDSRAEAIVCISNKVVILCGGVGCGGADCGVGAAGEVAEDVDAAGVVVDADGAVGVDGDGDAVGDGRAVVHVDGGGGVALGGGADGDERARCARQSDGGEVERECGEAGRHGVGDAERRVRVNSRRRRLRQPLRPRRSPPTPRRTPQRQLNLPPPSADG